jgi:hypothetical protein
MVRFHAQRKKGVRYRLIEHEIGLTREMVLDWNFERQCLAVVAAT